MNQTSHTGLSKPGLERMYRAMSGFVERKEMPGLVALVSRHGDTHVETLGTLSFTNPSPMRRDTIFRIASITKPVTAVAAMILLEECRLRLDDSVDEWLPELANRRVLKSLASEIDDTVPAKRALTVRDLLTFRMGFGSVMAMPGTYPIQKFIKEYRLGGDGPMLPNEAPSLDEWLKRLGSLPLIAQPGERWMYQTSADALGALIQRVSGKPLGEFMRESIFEPLGMKDTGFYVPIEKIGRLPGFYFFNQEANKLDDFDDPANSAWASPPAGESGGGGLVSTIDDYFAFSQMMLNKGRYGGEQILSRASVELMTSDQLNAAEREGAEIFFGTHSSWGLGMAVDIGRKEIYHNPGRFGWAGGFGTIAYVDPAEELIGILFTQRMMDSPEPPKVFDDFWTTAYGAME
ncbi:serine hydrolase domain-containing protein [Fimbriimonas ginsengisoli]|uniref:Beta-lactamase n=1 Tax=Fimbriimonas ginsengisoli Gsoil 348 TaxID=661478 RepID=A0A068NX25_FIMGI|nr:serine hydrolase domain-containing protein [Fimbriimonas ginsengisoli]AIE87917.1 beta-lactamase [Fimbriimonas ginsengisoli Gsoil 348]